MVLSYQVFDHSDRPIIDEKPLDIPAHSLVKVPKEDSHGIQADLRAHLIQLLLSLLHIERDLEFLGWQEALIAFEVRRLDRVT